MVSLESIPIHQFEVGLGSDEYKYMFEKLKEASKILLIPAAVLYFLGFICVNAYFARFGIVSFDLINSRFIIAGIYPLISLSVVLYLSWNLYTKCPGSKFFDIKSWKDRYKTLLEFLFLVFGSAYVLSLLMNLGMYKPPTEQQELIFKPIFGDKDFVGKLIAQLPIDISASANFISKAGLYAFSYLFLLLLCAVLLRYSYKWISNLNDKRSYLGSMLKPDEASFFHKPELLKQEEEKEKNYSNYFSFLIFTGDLLFVSVYLAIFIYSYRKLGVELFDFQSFALNQPVTTGLIFSWIFSSMVAVYIFLTTTELPAEQLKLKLTEQVTHYGKLQWAVQQLIIPVLASLFVFGATVFPKIPFAIGGGEPRLVKLTMADSNHAFNDEKMFLIGESNQFFFVIATNDNGKNGRALQINKTIVSYIETRGTNEKDNSNR